MAPGRVQHEHPAQHRFPVWWTGDRVPMQASVESMVDSCVYDFKPYVHIGKAKAATHATRVISRCRHCVGR